MTIEWPRDEATLANLKNTRVTLAFGRRAVFLKTTAVPDTSLPEVRRILTVRAAELFPLAAGDIAMDVRLTDEVGLTGRLAVIAAVSATELRRALAACHAHGVKVDAVVPAAGAAEAAAREAGLPEAAVVSPLSEGVAIDLIGGGRLRYSRVIGSNGDLSAEVLRTATAANMALPPIWQGALTETMPADGFRFELPEVVRKRETGREQGRIRFAALLFLASLALAAFAYDASSTFNALEARRIADAKRVTTKATRVKSEAETKAQASIAVNTALQRAFKPAQRASDVAVLAGNRLPPGAWLTGVTYERGKAATFRGTAKKSEDVANYLDRLRKEKRLRGVELIFATDGAIEKVPVVQFSISAFPVGNIPLTEAAEGGARR